MKSTNQCEFDTGKPCEMWKSLLIRLITHSQNRILNFGLIDQHGLVNIASIVTISQIESKKISKNCKKVKFNEIFRAKILCEKAS